VAFGVPDDAPVQRRHALRGAVPGIGARDYVLLWGGGLWNWFDPLTLVRGVALAAEQVPSLRLYFLAAAARPRRTRSISPSDFLGLRKLANASRKASRC